MARTYIPDYFKQVHELHQYLANHGSILRAAIILIDPTAGAAFDTLVAAVAAIDTLRVLLDPILP